MSATVEVEGPTFEYRKGQGQCVAYEIVVTEDGEELRREEVADLLHRLPDDPDEAADVVRDRVEAMADDLRQTYDAGGEREAALREVLG